MGIVVIIIILIGVFAGLMSFGLDRKSMGVALVFIGIIFFRILMLILSRSNSTTNETGNEGSGDGGIEYTIYPDYPPSSNHPMLPSGGDDEVIEGEIIETKQLSWHEQKRIAVERRQIETTKEYEKRLLETGKKVKRYE